jgi:acyl dehydratase
MKTFESLDQLAACLGQEVALSPWKAIDQAQIDAFALVTGDQQWIHVDQERAAQGPFGSTIAHGFFTLSLLPWFFEQSMAIDKVRMGVNYGLNKVRFMAPVPVNSRVRARFHLAEVQALEGQGMQFLWQVTIEREGSDKPVCSAQSLLRFYT